MAKAPHLRAKCGGLFLLVFCLCGTELFLGGNQKKGPQKRSIFFRKGPQKRSQNRIKKGPQKRGQIWAKKVRKNGLTVLPSFLP